MPLAARVTDNHICPLTNPPANTPHVGGPINPPGVINVKIGGQFAATVGSICTCAGPPDSITKGSMTVKIGGKSAARVGDATAHGGTIQTGCATVSIGG
jgi:uncharacterized Zn-binding protein involved in type VI secretion